MFSDGTVGKTCLLKRFHHGTFKSDYVPTMMDTFVHHTFYKNETVSIQIHDTAGQEDYSRIRPLSYPNTDIFLICFSLGDVSSFKNVQSDWIPELVHFHKTNSNDNDKKPKYMLVGMKSDLENCSSLSEKISDEAVATLIKEVKNYIEISGYVKCSAKSGKGIKSVFEKACAVVLHKHSLHVESTLSTIAECAYTVLTLSLVACYTWNLFQFGAVRNLPMRRHRILH